MKLSLIITFFSLSLFAQTEKTIDQAIALFRSQEFEKAGEIFEELMEDEPEIDSLYFYAGLNLMRMEEYGDAADAISRAIELRPKDSNYYINLGNAYGLDALNSSIFSKFSLAKKSKEAYLKAVEIEPENLNAHFALASYYYQAPGIAGGDTEKAIEHANFIKERDEVRGRSLLAQIFANNDQLAKAEKEFKILDEKVKNDSSQFFIYNSYGYFLLNQNRVEEAIEKFQKQISLAPNNANAYDSLGDGYLAADNKEKAAESFRKALEIDPDFEPSKEKLEEIEN